MDTDGEIPTCLICGAENKACDHNKSGEKAIVSMVQRGKNTERPKMRMPQQRVPFGKAGYVGQGDRVEVYDRNNPNIRFVQQDEEPSEAVVKARAKNKKKESKDGEDNS